MSPPNWKSAASEDAKAAMIGKPWGAEVKAELWYELSPDVNPLTSVERQEVVSKFFVSGEASLQDVELQEEPLLPKTHPTTLLHLHGNLRLLPCVELRGRSCPLLKVQIEGLNLINFCLLWGVPKDYKAKLEAYTTGSAHSSEV